MEKTILVGLNNKFSTNTNKWLISFVGLFYLITVTFIWNINLNNINPISMILWIALILNGIYNIVFGMTAFSITSKYAMRLKVNDSLLEFKSAYLKPVIKLNWDEINQIKLDAYNVNFQLEKRNAVFRYRSNSEVSKEINQTLREIAEQKNIPVTVG